jgi:serine/threonine protein kinase/predicted Zn-dependent peptidase
MTQPTYDKSTRELHLHQVLASYLESSHRGEAPDREMFMAQHAEFAAELQAFFADHDRMAELAQGDHCHRETPANRETVAPQVNRGAAISDLDSIRTSESPVRYFGNYELVHEIARGGMGVVYLARQRTLNRVVAVKMILAGQLASQSDVQRFLAEAQAAAGLRHPNIVAIHEVGETDGQYFFSMDFIEGKDLAAISRKNSLAPSQAARYVSIIAGAIHYAHGQGILHRDLKPSNVVIDKDDQPHVMDFGLAKRIEGGSDLTGTGQAVGTPSYMPPEQAAGNRLAVGPRSDVYALGAILYELLTGRPPFRAQSALDTLLQVLESEPVAPRLLNPSIPRDIETICLKCLEKEPARRYATAESLAEELRRFLRGEPIQARPLTSIGRAWRWCLRNPGMACLSGGLVCALIGGMIGIAAQHSRAQQEVAQNKKLRDVAEMAAEDKTLHYQLDNGLSVLIRPVDGAERAALVVLFSIGHDHDPAGQSGMAHLTEHIFVTAAAGSSPARTVDDLLRRYPGSWNAQTGDRYTVIAAEFPPDQLANEIGEAATRMGELRVVESDIARELPRLGDELRNMYAAIPTLAARNAVREMVRPAVGGQFGGSIEQMQSITAEGIQERWKRFYKPRNAILAMSGKLDLAVARESVATHFGPLPAGDPIPHARQRGKTQLGQTNRQKVTPIQPNAAPEVALAFPAPDPTDQLFPAFLILAARLQNNSGRFRAIRNNSANNMGDFPVIFAPLDDPGLLYVRSSVPEGESPDDTIGRIEQAVSELVAGDLRSSDATLTKNTFAFLLGTAPLPDAFLKQNTYGTAFRIGRRAQLGVRAGTLTKAIDSVTAEELSQAAAQYFAPARRATAVITIN